jgi:two-component system, sporulation sensor kinase E
VSKPFQYIDLYQNKSRLKWISISIAILIGLGSIIYTNSLVSELREREKRLISLYASTIEFTGNYGIAENLMFVFQEIVITNNSIPVILTDEDGNPIDYKNVKVDSSQGLNKVMERLKKELVIMKTEHEPILVSLRTEDGEILQNQYVYYRNSLLLTQLRYYPYAQLSVIFVFVLLAYTAFSYSRTAEQNRVWVGLAKETAHQLGTPISSLMAWLEVLRSEPSMWSNEVANEFDKDIKKLEMITQRFSSIGSVPSLQEEDVVEVIKNTLNYLKPRISSKVKLVVIHNEQPIYCHLNKALFDWVIENLCKNAVDAMSGIGLIEIEIQSDAKGVIIDISDNGRGIPKNKLKYVFQPGYTTKTRGWGLGLTLVKRIIENYHRGRIFVKNSQENTGTTFRIILPK